MAEELSEAQQKSAARQFLVNRAEHHKGVITRAIPALGVGVVIAMLLESDTVNKNTWLSTTWYARGLVLLALGYAALNKGGTTPDGQTYQKVGWGLMATGALILYRDHTNRKQFEDQKKAETKGFDASNYSFETGRATQASPREVQHFDKATNRWYRWFQDKNGYVQSNGTPRTQIWDAKRQTWIDVLPDNTVAQTAGPDETPTHRAQNRRAEIFG